MLGMRSKKKVINYIKYHTLHLVWFCQESNLLDSSLVIQSCACMPFVGSFFSSDLIISFVLVQKPTKIARKEYKVMS